MSLFAVGTRSLDAEAFDDLLDRLDGRELPSVTLAERVHHGCGYNTFDLTDGERTLAGVCMPTDQTVTCNYTDAEHVPTSAVLIRQDTEPRTAWFLPADEVDSCPALPDLRQAFHEGASYTERDARYRYHFKDGETFVAVSDSNPVQRLDDPVTFTAVEYLGGMFPQKWFLETPSGEYWYLRERSGSIRLYNSIEDMGRDQLRFKAFVGDEHPGTRLEPHEVLNIISAVDYITIVDNPSDTVADEAHEQYWADYPPDEFTDLEFDLDSDE